MQKILITGGAGFVGSHVVRYLLEKGQGVLVLDDLSTGFGDAVPEGLLVRGSVGDARLLDEVFSSHQIRAVMHFAGSVEVAESVRAPSGYYLNNLGNTLVLLDAMVRHGVRKFVFSSTAAIFGTPESVPLDEAHAKSPINPYGRSKLLVEEVLKDFHSAYGLQYGCLRYFNAAGADPQGRLGERHDPETHLIPLVLQAAAGRLPGFRIFGDDYPTPDGTCIRDYVHVLDLAQAHWLLLRHMESTPGSFEFNLGNGAGYSILEVIAAAREVTGVDFPVAVSARRDGDPPILVADSRRARSVLGWNPEFPGLADMIEHAWRWERSKGTKW